MVGISSVAFSTLVDAIMAVAMVVAMVVAAKVALKPVGTGIGTSNDASAVLAHAHYLLAYEANTLYRKSRVLTLIPSVGCPGMIPDPRRKSGM